MPIVASPEAHLELSDIDFPQISLWWRVSLANEHLDTISLDSPGLAGNFRSQNTFIGIRVGA